MMMPKSRVRNVSARSTLAFNTHQNNALAGDSRCCRHSCHHSCHQCHTSPHQPLPRSQHTPFKDVNIHGFPPGSCPQRDARPRRESQMKHRDACWQCGLFLATTCSRAAHPPLPKLRSSLACTINVTKRSAAMVAAIPAIKTVLPAMSVLIFHAASPHTQHQCTRAPSM